jgi:hypothetical protein
MTVVAILVFLPKEMQIGGKQVVFQEISVGTENQSHSAVK